MCWTTSTEKGWGSRLTSRCPQSGSSAAWTRRRENGPPDRFLTLLHIEWRGKPGTIRVDNGPEYISEKLRLWAEKRGITIQHIQPGQPQQNANVERYNRTVRHEWLDQYIIESIEEAQDQATQWLWTYNNDRPNMGIGGITPAMKLKMAA
jgi:putative transposase